MQTSGLQQSAATVQLWPWAWHGARQMPAVVSQLFEQHSPFAVHRSPFGAQAAQVPFAVSGGVTVQRPVQHVPAPAVQAPPVATQAVQVPPVQTYPAVQQAGAGAPGVQVAPDARLHAGGGGAMSVQTFLPSMFSQVNGLQHSLDAVQAIPRVLQVVADEQWRTPFASGTHGAYPQH